MKTYFLISALTFLSVNVAHASMSKCPTTQVSKISAECRAEVLAAIQNDKTAKVIRDTLEKNYELKSCKMSPDKANWKYVPAEAVGAYLEISTFISCDGPGYDGYSLGGKYYLDDNAPSFVFLSLQVSEFE
jgi:hypothetical protein